MLLPAKQSVEPATLWQAVVAGGVKPTEIRYAAQRLDAKQMAPLLQTASRPAVTR